MKKSKFTEQQIAFTLQQAESGTRMLPTRISAEIVLHAGADVTYRRGGRVF
jgi:hypothetical protein